MLIILMTLEATVYNIAVLSIIVQALKCQCHETFFFVLTE
jgi:hypothetical protein